MTKLRVEAVEKVAKIYRHQWPEATKYEGMMYYDGPNPRLGLRLEDDGTATLIDYGSGTEEAETFANPQSAMGKFYKMVRELDEPLLMSPLDEINTQGKAGNLRVRAQEAVIPNHYYVVTMSFNHLSSELIYKDEGTDLSQLLEKTSSVLRSDEMRQRYEQGLAKLKRSYGWENQDPDIFTELSFYVYEVTEDKEEIILQTGYNLKSANYDYDAIVQRIDSEAIVPFLDDPEYREESKKRIDAPSIQSKPRLPNATPTDYLQPRPESYAYNPRDFNAMTKLRVHADSFNPYKMRKVIPEKLPIVDMPKPKEIWPPRDPRYTTEHSVYESDFVMVDGQQGIEWVNLEYVEPNDLQKLKEQIATNGEANLKDTSLYDFCANDTIFEIDVVHGWAAITDVGEVAVFDTKDEAEDHFYRSKQTED